jgi:hypothetical protein
MTELWNVVVVGIVVDPVVVASSLSSVSDDSGRF